MRLKNLLWADKLFFPVVLYNNLISCCCYKQLCEWAVMLSHVQHERFPSFLSCRVLQSAAREHDTQKPPHVHTRDPRLCCHRLRHRSFEKLHPRVTWWGRRKGKRGHARGTTAGAGALRAQAFVTDREDTLQHNRLDDLNSTDMWKKQKTRKEISHRWNSLAKTSFY